MLIHILTITLTYSLPTLDLLTAFCPVVVRESLRTVFCSQFFMSVVSKGFWRFSDL